MSATIRSRCSDSSAAPAIEADLKPIDAIDPFSRLDLVNLFLPALPVLRDVFRDWHPDREATITRIVSHDPSLQRSMGVTGRFHNRWYMTHEARRCWNTWLQDASSMVSAEALLDGGVREIMRPEEVRRRWMRMRCETFGASLAPNNVGWRLEVDDLPVWSTALLARLTYDGRAWIRHIDGAMVRDLPP